MRKIILAGLAICVLLSMMAGCGTPTPPLSATGETVTIIDFDGRYMEIPVPVEHIVSINSGMSALICAFGDGDKIVGRDSYSTFPTYLKDVFVVGQSSAYPNIELILEQKPDIVVADTMFNEDQREKLEAAGIPVIIDSTGGADRIIPIIKNFGLLLGKKEKAEEITDFIEYYRGIVSQRLAAHMLEGGTLPLVFFERRHAYNSTNAQTSFHKTLAEAGGINIAAAEPVSSPKLSAEWVLERNPEVIINRISGDSSAGEMAEIRDEIMMRPGLEDVKAVKDGRVYIIKADVFLTFRYPVGLLYYAKWFHPELFQDIDPEAVHQELIEKFFGKDQWQNLKEKFAFPEPDDIAVPEPDDVAE